MAGRDQLLRKVNESLFTVGLEPIKKEHLDVLCEVIVEFLRDGETVKIKNFGTFYRQLQAPRKAQNPKTFEEVRTPARAKIQLKTYLKPFELNPGEQEQLKIRKARLADDAKQKESRILAQQEKQLC